MKRMPFFATTIMPMPALFRARWLAWALLASALCACGNKGPLVLPTDPPPEETAEVPSAAATDAGAEADPLPADQIDAPATVPPADASVPVDPEADDTSDDEPPAGG